MNFDRQNIIEQAQRAVSKKNAQAFADDLTRAAQDAVARRKAGYVDESRTVVKPTLAPATPVLDAFLPKKEGNVDKLSALYNQTLGGFGVVGAMNTPSMGKTMAQAAYNNHVQFYSSASPEDAGRRQAWLADAESRVKTMPEGKERNELEEQINRYKRGEGEWASYSQDGSHQTGFVNATVDSYMNLLNDKEFMDKAERSVGLTHIPDAEEAERHKAMRTSGYTVVTPKYGEPYYVSNYDGAVMVKDGDELVHPELKTGKYDYNDPLGIYLSLTPEDKSTLSTAGNDVRSYAFNRGQHDHWDMLTPEEVLIYYGLLNDSLTGGDSSRAEQFLSDMKETLHHRFQNGLTANTIRKYWEADDARRANMGLETVLRSAESGAAGFVQLAIGLLTGNDPNYYSPAFEGMHFTNAVRGERAKDFDQKAPNLDILGYSAGDLYQLGMSAIDSTAASFIPGGQVLLGARAAANKGYELHTEGVNTEAAIPAAIASGAVEMAMEKVGIDRLKLLRTRDVSSWVDFGLNVLKQAGAEYGEEAATELADGFIDYFARTTESDWAKLLEKHNGDWGKFAADVLSQVNKAGIGGALSGFGSSVTALPNAAATITQNRDAVTQVNPEIATPQPEMTPAEKGALEMAKLFGVKDYPGVESKVDTTEQAAEITPQRITDEDYKDNNSPVWRNVEYNDDATKNSITQSTHEEMVSDGKIVKVPEATMESVDSTVPDLRGMKKADRTPILKKAFATLKSNLRQFLSGFSGQSFEFEVNGKILDARLYGTGINEVLEKVNKEKAGMLYSTEEIFGNARYLYSTPDYAGDPNVYRWNYFYTPVQIGDDIVGVRIAIRDVIQGTQRLPESQIYNWGIKKDTSLDGVRPVVSDSTHGVSSDVSNNSIPTPPPNVKPEESVGTANPSVGAADQGFDPYSTLQYEHGNKPDRAGTVRDINVPNKDSTGRRVSDMAANLYGSSATADSMVPVLEKLIAAGYFGADTKHNADTLNSSIAEISSRGVTSVSMEISEAVVNGKTSDDLLAKALALYEGYQAEGDMVSAGEMAVYAAELGRTAGRTLNVAKLTQSLTPDGQLAARLKMAERAKKEANANKKTGKKIDVTISDETRQDFRNVANATETIITDTAKELQRGFKADTAAAAKEAVKKLPRKKKTKDTKAKAEKDPLSAAADTGIRAGGTAAKSAIAQAKGEAPTKDKLYRAIMDFINSKKKRVAEKGKSDRSIQTLLEYYSNHENFSTAWWAARRQADLAISGDEKARAILDEFLYSADAMMEGDELSVDSVARKAAKEATKGAGINIGDVVTGTMGKKVNALLALGKYLDSTYENSSEMANTVTKAFRVELAERRDSIFEKENAARNIMRKAVRETGSQMSNLLTATQAEKLDALDKAIEYVRDHYTFPWEAGNTYNDMVAAEFFGELAQRRDNLFDKEGGSREVMRRAARETGAKLSDILTATQAEKLDALNKITKWVAEHYNLPGEEIGMLSDLMAEEYYKDLTERRDARLSDAEKKRIVMRGAAKESGVKISDLLTESLQNKNAALEKIQAYVQEHYSLPTDEASVLAKTMQDAFFEELSDRQAKRLDAMFRQNDSPAKAPKDTAQKLHELANLGAFSKDGDISRAALKKLFGADGLKLPQDLMDYYSTLSDARKAQVDARIIAEIAKQLPGSFSGSLRKLRYGAMLLNPSTHVTNIVGSFGQFTQQVFARDGISAVIEAGLSKVTGGNFKRTKALLNMASSADRALLNAAYLDYGGILHNDGEVARQIQNGGRYDYYRDQLSEARRQMKISGEGKAAKVTNAVLGAVEAVSDFNADLMKKEDALFGINAYAFSLASYMKANGLTEITNEARAYAIAQAQECTFHDESTIYQWCLKNLPDGFFRDAVMPFLKTPANVADKAFTYSPGGFVKAGYDLLQMARYKNGETEHAAKMRQKYTGAKAVADFSSGLVGSGLWFLGYMLAKAGLIRITGTGSDEEREYEELMGAKPYSAFIGGEWVSMSNFAPTIIPMFTGAALYETGANAASGNATEEDVLTSLFAITDPIMNNTMLSGLDGVMYAIRYADEGEPVIATIAKEMVESYVNQYFPSFLRRIAYATDNKVRTTYEDPKDPLSRVKQDYMAQIPGLRDELPQKYDIWGQPFTYNDIGGDDLGSIALRTVSPFRVYDVHSTPIDGEIKRLLGSGFTKATPGADNSKTITRNYIDETGEEKSEKINLTAQQHETYQKTEGQAAYKMAELIINSDAYKELPDTYKATALELAYKHADELGKAAAVDNYTYDIPAYLNGSTETTQAEADAILEKVYQDWSGLSPTGYAKAAKYGIDEAAASKMAADVARKRNLSGDTSTYGTYRAVLESLDGADKKERDKWLDIYGMSETARQQLTQAETLGITPSNFVGLMEYASAEKNEKRNFSIPRHLELVGSGLNDSTAKSVQRATSGLSPEGEYKTVRDIQKLEAITDLSSLSNKQKEAAILAYTDDGLDAKYHDLTRQIKNATPDDFVEYYRACVDGKNKSEDIAALRALGLSPDVAEQIYKIYNPSKKK